MIQIYKAMKNLEKMKKIPLLRVADMKLIKETHSLLEKAEMKLEEQAEMKLEEQAEQYCHWLQQDGENSDCWLVCDDKLFCLNNGTPSENGMLFCPYCGKNIDEITYKEQFPDTEDDEDYEPKPNYWGEY